MGIENSVVETGPLTVIVPGVVSTYGALGSNFKTLINKTKEGLDPDFIPYWTQNIVCTAVKSSPWQPNERLPTSVSTTTGIPHLPTAR